MTFAIRRVFATFSQLLLLALFAVLPSHAFASITAVIAPVSSPVFTQQTITLDGSGSTASLPIVSYNWLITAGPGSCCINNSGAAIAQFLAPIAGTYTIQYSSCLVFSIE